MHRKWEAGRDGRATLDRICDRARAFLRPGGLLLLVHSSLLGLEPTLAALRAHGLPADMAVSRRGPLGPLMNGRRAHLEATGMLDEGQDEEDVLGIRARNAPCAR